MTTAIQAYAADINSHHEQATHHAETAIEHAKKAGELLLLAKKELRHGEFVSWIEANCTVSARQAQRYMRAAQGKPITARAIKYDTVSHLADMGRGGQYVAETIKELRARVHVLKAEIDAVRVSRDTYITENMEMTKTLAYWRRQADRKVAGMIDAAGAEAH